MSKTQIKRQRISAILTTMLLVLMLLYSNGATAFAAFNDPYADTDFETFLTQQGFPESYKGELRRLHTMYPNWKFEAQHTNLEWDTVISAESRLGLNLVGGNSISSWKSLQQGAYNWDQGKWISFDSGNWVQASEELIRYYMDPRNFMDDKSIFQFLKQSYDPDVQTRDGLVAATEGSFLAGTYDEGGDTSYPDVLMQAAEKSGVNPYVLASMIIVEQGANGKGNSISGTVKGYEGFYNYFNIGSYAAGGKTAVQRGLWYAQGSGNGATSYDRPWNTRTRSIIGGACYYGSNYVQKGQDTLYLKKFNVQGSNMYAHQYMTNVSAATAEAQKAAKAYKDIARNVVLTFKIPVYTNMPETFSAKPTGNEPPSRLPEKNPVIPNKTPEDTPAEPQPSTPVEKEKPAQPPKENPAEDKPVEQPKEQPVEDKPVEQPKEQPVEDKPVEQPKEQPVEDKPVEQPKEQPVKENPAEPIPTAVQQEEADPPIPEEEPQETNGEILLSDVSGEVGSTVEMDLSIRIPDDTLAKAKVNLAYDPAKLALADSVNTSGGEGSATINMDGSDSANAVVKFTVLQEGEYPISTSSYEVRTVDEEMLVLKKGNAKVTGKKADTEPLRETASVTSNSESSASSPDEPYIPNEEQDSGSELVQRESSASNQTPINPANVQAKTKVVKDGSGIIIETGTNSETGAQARVVPEKKDIRITAEKKADSANEGSILKDKKTKDQPEQDSPKKILLSLLVILLSGVTAVGLYFKFR